jgi:rhamnosyltransferase
MSNAISVIIPTLNASAHIKSLLESLNRQTIKPTEIMIVDSSSDDDTLALASWFNVTAFTIQRKAFDHGGSRYDAVKLAKGDILLFLTQDAIPANNQYIQQLIEPLKDPRIAASFGRQLPQPSAIPPERFARLFNYHERPIVKGAEDKQRLGIKTYYFSNVCSALKRQPYEEVGGFPTKSIVNEDMTLAAKLIHRGYQIAYAPAATVVHSHNYSLSRQFKRYFDIGVSLKDQEWILKSVSAEGEGAKFIVYEMRYLIKEKAYRYIPYAIGEALFKYVGYQLGLNYKKLPFRVAQACSAQKQFWA